MNFLRVEVDELQAFFFFWGAMMMKQVIKVLSFFFSPSLFPDGSSTKDSDLGSVHTDSGRRTSGAQVWGPGGAVFAQFETYCLLGVPGKEGLLDPDLKNGEVATRTP